MIMLGEFAARWTRSWVGGVTLFLCAAGAVKTGVSSAQVATNQASEKVAAPATKWLDCWAVSFLPTLVNGAQQTVPTFNNQTFRLVVFTKLGGTQVRVKFNNKFEKSPLIIGAA